MSRLGGFWRRLFAPSVQLLVLAGGCGLIGMPSEATSESETHFLMRCEDRCGEGLTCVCGICTQPCESNDGCTALSALAECRPVADDSCMVAHAGTCDVTCEREEDCGALGENFGCNNGTCRQILDFETEQPLQVATPGAAGAGSLLGSAGAAGSDGGGNPIDSHFTTEADSHSVCTLASDGCDTGGSGVEFVVDLSAPMLAPSTNGNTLFGNARVELEHYIEQMHPQQVGLTFFPNRETGTHTSEGLARETCIDSSLDVPMAPVDSAHRTRLLDALDAAQPLPGAGSPLLDAYRAAVEKWRTYPDLRVKVIAVVTAGVATYEEGCLGTSSEPVDLAPWYDAIAEAHAEGIKTLVFGPKGDSTDAALSRAARGGEGLQCGCPSDAAGCRCSDDGPEPCHEDLSSDMSRAIAGFVERYECPERQECSYEFASPEPAVPWDPESARVRVLLDGTSLMVRPNDAAPCEVGFHATEEGGTVRVELCESTCDLLRCLPATVTWEIGCSAPPLD